MHTWAFFVSLPAGLALLLASEPGVARASTAVYVTSLLAVFGASAAYHRLTLGPTARRRMRQLDHSMIYVLIAGTYTPVCAVILPGEWGIPLLSVSWAGAAAGIGFTVGGVERFGVLTNILYLVLGWSVLVGLPVLHGRMSDTGFALLVVGGLVYTAGAIVLFRHRPDPAPAVFGFHEVWHACTVVAAAAHYGMVWSVVVK
jgi:hemolysin III